MDAQKISEAAATIKKVEHATSWFNEINRGSKNLPTTDVVIETVGNITHLPGHGEAKHYLRQAFNHHRDQILDLAKRLASQDRVVAEQDIRDEVAGV